MEHSPENWILHSEHNNEYIDIDDSHGFRICSISLEAAKEKGALLEAKANAERIVDCVNACKNIPNEYLKNGLMKKLLSDYLSKM